MTLQNRVTPWGELIADPARGTLMGNRGRLHGAERRPLRLFQTRRWIFCALAFRGRRRALMAPGQYTELFFLDEATALAAGHRPCAECSRARFRAFVERWAAANPRLCPAGPPGADALDAQLHRERLAEARGPDGRRKRVFAAALDGLPDGCLVALGADQTPHLVRGAWLHPWGPAGYGPPAARPRAGEALVLTPASVVRALAHGYAPALHPSAG